MFETHSQNTFHPQKISRLQSISSASSFHPHRQSNETSDGFDQVWHHVPSAEAS